MRIFSSSELVEPHIIPLKVRLAVALKEEAKWQVFVRVCGHWILLLYRILKLYWAYTCNFVVYCVLFVMMSTNIVKKPAVSEEGHFFDSLFFVLLVSLASMQIKSFWNPFSKVKLRT